MQFHEVGWKLSEEDVQRSLSSERVEFYALSGGDQGCLMEALLRNNIV